MVEMEISNDCWSLNAIVNECYRKTKPQALAPPDSPKPVTPATTITTATILQENGGGFPVINNSNSFSSEPSPFFAAAAAVADGSSFDELINLYRPFLCQSADISSAAVAENLMLPQIPHQQLQLFDMNAFQQQQQQQQIPVGQLLLQPRSSQNRRLASCSIGHQCIHKKKNKYEERRICRLTAEELNGDRWAWRKYGQKPIKGSPYPRNYYRCSSSKGCTARKQVERSPSHPEIYVVTYTGTHHHPRPAPRNSMAARVKLVNSISNPPPDPTSLPNKESPPKPPPGRNTTISGSGSGGGDTSIKNIGDEEEDDDDDGENYGILIPNSMADSELLMGMEQLRMEQRENRKYNRNGYECELHKYALNPGMNMGFGGNEKEKEKGLFGEGEYNEIQEMDSSGGGGEDDSPTPTTLAAAHESPNGRGHKIWNNKIRTASTTNRPSYPNFLLF